MSASRWAWPPGVVDRRYADPLDAASPGGVPVVLAEWFALVGGRLREMTADEAAYTRLTGVLGWDPADGT